MPRTKKSYLEYYRDPRWQKKRLEVMERDGFACVRCGDKDSTLNVHHCYYQDGQVPWDYRNESLKTLCEECHEDEKESLKEARSQLLRMLGQAGMMSDDIDCIGIDVGYHLYRFGTQGFANDLRLWLDERGKNRG